MATLIRYEQIEITLFCILFECTIMQQFYLSGMVFIGSYLTEIAPSQPSSHWKFERYVSVAMLTLIPTGIIYPSAAVDWALAVVVPIHNHW